MKLLAITFTLSTLCTLAQTKSNGFTNLLNYSDFSNFTLFVLVPEKRVNAEADMVDSANHYLLPKGYLSNDPTQSVFHYVTFQGKTMLRVSGELLGFLMTKEHFSNYHFKMRFKWGKKWQWLGPRPRDSGIFYHNIPEAANQHECNIHDGDIGSYWTFGPTVQIPAQFSNKLPRSITEIIPIIKHVIPSLRPEMPIYDPQAPLMRIQLDSLHQVCVAQPIADKPVGDWNLLEIYTFGDTSYHVVNGICVLKLFEARYTHKGVDVPLRSGGITLQSEGGEMYVEYMQIRPIKALPKQY